MKDESIYWLAAAVLAGATLLTPAPTEARQDYQLSISGSNADRCADITARSSGRIARAAEAFTLSRSEAPTLEVRGEERGQIRARGWDRPDYSVEACRIAVAGDDQAAQQLLQSIKVNRAGPRFSASGPAGSDLQWAVIYIVHAPKGAALDLETKNGPLTVQDVDGTVKARAGNGPVAISGCSGTVEAHAANGPVSFSGSGGDVRLDANNGPISVRLAGDEWNGPQLDAHTGNGPLSVALSNGYRSGIRVETGRGPLSCSVDACRNATTDLTGNRRILQLNGGNPTVHFSTGNGPVSIGAAKAGRRII
jgi:hypothetical protein